MKEQWEEIASEFGHRLINIAKQRNWKLGWKRYGKRLGLDYEETKSLMQWLLDADLEEIEEPENEEPDRSQYEHSKLWYFVEERDVYVTTLPSRKKPLVLPGDVWRAMRDAYSNWDGAPSSVIELARRFGMARRTVVELLKAMETTHSSSPWTEEELSDLGNDELVEDLLRRKEEAVYAKAQKRIWRDIERDANKWRSVERGFLTPLGDFMPPPAAEVPRLPLNAAESEYMVILGLSDWHLGMIGADYAMDGYDKDIAIKRLNESLDALMGRITKRGRPTKIVLPIGGDQIHADTYNRTTTSGRVTVELDGTMRTLVSEYMEIMTLLVRQLASIGSTVELVPCFGNHDKLTSIVVYSALKGMFGESPNITARDDLRDVQVIVFGDVMVALNHGDVHRPKDLGDILPRDFREEWGSTQFHHALCGHYHTKASFMDKSGLMIDYMSSLAGSDDWHSSQGYGGPGSRHGMDAFVFEADKGLVTVEHEPVRK